MDCPKCGRAMKQINNEAAAIKLYWCVACHQFEEQRAGVRAREESPAPYATPA